MNTDAPWPGPSEAEARVLEIQAKLHRWAKSAPNRQFDDLYNLVYDPAVLVVAWSRVRTNRGARSAGVDKVEPRSIASPTERFLPLLRDELKARRFTPLPVCERYIPKAVGKTRRLGIATARDRTVQAALKLLLEPIWEADFRSFSYGFRPKRRAQDAMAEIYNFATNSYEWVLEADITACFDEIAHPALMDRLRRRVGDKRVLALVKAFLKAGILSEDGVTRETATGTPQGGILSPLLANIALSVLDDRFAEAWASFGNSSWSRQKRRQKGLPTYRLVKGYPGARMCPGLGVRSGNSRRASRSSASVTWSNSILPISADDPAAVRRTPEAGTIPGRSGITQYVGRVGSSVGDSRRPIATRAGSRWSISDVSTTPACSASQPGNAPPKALSRTSRLTWSHQFTRTTLALPALNRSVARSAPSTANIVFSKLAFMIRMPLPPCRNRSATMSRTQATKASAPRLVVPGKSRPPPDVGWDL